jgi:type II secretory pathway pseudopilin PulG
MIVVAIIGLLTVLALPSFSEARKQSQGRRILNDARQMDGAIDQWATNNNMSDGAHIDTSAAGTYLKSSWKTTDALGKLFNVTVVGTTQISINTVTKTSLAVVGIDWALTLLEPSEGHNRAILR